MVFDGWKPELNALVRVEILDVTYVDAPSTPIATVELRVGPDDAAGLPFTLSGPEPDQRAEYIVTATVIAADTNAVIGRTVVAHPVMTFGYASTDVEVPVASTRPTAD